MRISARYISIRAARGRLHPCPWAFRPTIASVVSIKDATLDAFCSAKRVTLVGRSLGLEQVFVLAALRVEANAPAPSRTCWTNGAFPAAVGHDPAQRLLERAAQMSTPNFSPPLTRALSAGKAAAR